jgi:hypothetical protein
MNSVALALARLGRDRLAPLADELGWAFIATYPRTVDGRAWFAEHPGIAIIAPASRDLALELHEHVAT